MKDVHHFRQSGIGFPLDGRHHNGSTLPAGFLGQEQGELPIAGNETERFHFGRERI